MRSYESTLIHSDCGSYKKMKFGDIKGLSVGHAQRSCNLKTQDGDHHLQATKRVFRRNLTADTLILDFQPSELSENEFLGLS